jgi:release factor glutamine methyltransferase
MIVAATVAEALRSAAAALPNAESPQLDASRLLEHVLERDRSWLLAHGDETLHPPQQLAFEALVRKRASGVPVAYCTGTVGFYGRTFTVDERVLVPRPETERLVEGAIAWLRANGGENAVAADVGTGSGAIAVTLACELPGLNVFGVDLAHETLAVARRNAAVNNVAQHVSFLKGDLAAPLVRFAPFAAVLANLPYVPSAECAPAPDPVSFEPLVARDGGPDGLDLYRRLVPALPALLAPRAYVALEAAPANARALADLARATFPDAAIRVERDYAGADRIVTISVAEPL